MDGFAQQFGKAIYEAFESDQIKLWEIQTKDTHPHRSIFTFMRKKQTQPTEIAAVDSSAEYLKNEVFKPADFEGGNMIKDDGTVLPVLKQSTKDQEANARAFSASQEMNRKKPKKKTKKAPEEKYSVELEYLVIDGVVDGTYVTSIAKNQATPEPSIPEFIPLCHHSRHKHKKTIHCKIQEMLEENKYKTIIFLGQYYEELHEDETYCKLITKDIPPMASEYYRDIEIDDQPKKSSFFGKKEITYKKEYYPLLDEDMPVTVTALAAKHTHIGPLQSRPFIYVNIEHRETKTHLIISLIIDHCIVDQNNTFLWKDEKETWYSKSVAYTLEKWLKASKPDS